jgi:Domain of unknown function (DUF1707)
MTASNRRARGASVAGLLGWLAATGRETHQLARRRRVRQLRLTVADREVCTDELAEQYALGRLDEAELGRRVDLLHRAVTHGDLGPVFAGLPMPSLHAPAAQPGRWRWVVFAAGAWLALPFALLGLVLAVAGREVAAVVFGLPAFVWVMVLWRWASDPGHSGRRGPHDR